MSNEEIAKAFHEVYNVFWLKHRNENLAIDNAEGWQRLLDEGMALIQKHNECALVKHMVFDLMEELNRRARKSQ